MYSTIGHDLPDRHVIMNIAAFVFHLKGAGCKDFQNFDC